MDTIGRLMGLDIGRRRIGVALSDPSCLLGYPLGAVEVQGPEGGLEEICSWVAEYGVVRVVVGLPLLLDGSEGEEARYVQDWAERLRQRIAMPVVLWDERLSSVAAERALLEGGMRRERRRRHRDAVAAALILQNYLDAQRAPRDEGRE